MQAIANRLHSYIEKAINSNRAGSARIAAQIKVTPPDPRQAELQMLRLGRDLNTALRANANSFLYPALQKAVPVYNVSKKIEAVHIRPLNAAEGLRKAGALGEGEALVIKRDKKVFIIKDVYRASPDGQVISSLSCNGWPFKQVQGQLRLQAADQLALLTTARPPQQVAAKPAEHTRQAGAPSPTSSEQPRKAGPNRRGYPRQSQSASHQERRAPAQQDHKHELRDIKRSLPEAMQSRSRAPSDQEHLPLALQDHKHAVPHRPVGSSSQITPAVRQVVSAAVPSAVGPAALTAPAHTPSPVKHTRFAPQLEMPQSSRYNASQAVRDNRYPIAEDSPSRYRVRNRPGQLPNKADIHAADCRAQVIRALNLSGANRAALRNAVNEVLEDYSVSGFSWRQTPVAPAHFPKQNELTPSRIFLVFDRKESQVYAFRQDKSGHWTNGSRADGTPCHISPAGLIAQFPGQANDRFTGCFAMPN